MTRAVILDFIDFDFAGQSDIWADFLVLIGQIKSWCVWRGIGLGTILPLLSLHAFVEGGEDDADGNANQTEYSGPGKMDHDFESNPW